ncbi:MAG: hypothetical protein K1Y36_23115 [Blastocatellia bacterium]|nr:hypothetical protein [Blastocatellia bacterium]
MKILRPLILFLAVLGCGFLTGKAQEQPRTVHLFVALCDNKNQGIVPVPEKIGNGEDPARNLYWGSGEGFKGHFGHLKDWKPATTAAKPKSAVLERLVFRHSTSNLFIVADAYRGAEIKQAVADFLTAAATGKGESIEVQADGKIVRLSLAGGADCVAYIGHNGLMDFQLPTGPGAGGKGKAAIVLCCASEQYFLNRLTAGGSRPLLLTRQLMYPGSFLLKAALDGWLKNETPAQIRERAARAYAANQRISLRAARGVFSEL